MNWKIEILNKKRKFLPMGWGTFVEDTLVECTFVTLVEWNIGRTEHGSNGTLVERNIRPTEHSSNLTKPNLT